MKHWPSRTKKSSMKTYSLADGINQSVESIEIKDSQLTAVVNVDSFHYPTISVRRGMKLFSSHSGYINTIFKFLGNIYCGTNKGLYKRNGNSWAVVYEYSNTDNNRLWDSAQFFDGSKLYFIDGSLQLREYNGSALTTISNAPGSSSFLTTHANRFYLANRNDNLLSYSGLRDATDWTSTDKYVGTGKITVETEDGGKPTGLTSFADHVILFKQNTMHELFGEDSTNFWMASPYGVGCISDRTITSTNRALYWLGPDGVYEYMGGSAPRKISDPVKKYIEAINLSQGRHCVASNDGRFLYVSLVTGSSTLPNVTLKYDMDTQAWWVEDYVATSYFLDGQTFYMAIGDKIFTVEGSNDNGAQINWSLETKPFTDGDETSMKSLHKIWLVVDIEHGSNLNVYYSTNAEGEIWTLAKNISPTGTLQSAKIPIIINTPSEWFRIKVSGTGQAKIHRLIREMTRR